MKTGNYYSNLWQIKWNNNDAKEVKKAEKQKSKFEDKGFSFRYTTVNSITAECVSIYAAHL